MKTRLVIALFLAAACSLLAPHPRSQILAPIVFAQGHSGSFSAQAIDGSATATGTSSTCGTASLTTSHASDIIIAFLRTSDGAANPSVTAVSGGGLTWAQRGSAVTYTNAAGSSSMSQWWAFASGTLTSASLTCTLTGTSGSSATRINVFGVTNTNTTTPYDVNASLPGTNSSSTGAATSMAPASAISTTNANTMLIGYLTANNAFTTVTRPSGFNQMLATGSVNDLSDLVVSAAQSSISPSWSWSSGGQNSGLIVDALQHN